MTPCFTYGETKSYSTIKKFQNIMNMIDAYSNPALAPLSLVAATGGVLCF